MSSKPGPFNLGQTLNEALALHQQGRLDEAEKLYTRVLKAQRDNFDALHLLGMLNHQRGKAGEAFRLITTALKAQPRSPEALSNLAMVLHTLHRDDEALASVGKALALAPAHTEVLNTRGTILLDLKRPAEAMADFDAALLQNPRHLQARVNRGNALSDLGQPQSALADYDTALTLVPRHPLPLYNRGNALHALGRDEEAVQSYDRALAAAPNHLKAWLNRGMALASLNRHQDAVSSYGRALSLQPENAEAHFNAALSLLTLGDYPRGFVEYEWRWKRAGMTARKEFRRPPWLGDTPLNGKTIVLHAEQGLGDTVMFARYAPLLARAGSKVVLEVQPELKTLLAGVEGVSAVIGRGESLPAYDLHCPLGSLPLALKTELSSVPAPIPYLRAGERELAKWRPRLEVLPGPRIGLAWSGRASHVNDRNRSLPLAQLDSLLSVPNVCFISVQRELRPADAAMLAQKPRIHHLGEELTDFADTAAVLALCDLVVTVDTSVAHVAGAMGRPAFVLLPFQPDWRWTLDRDSSPWYPAIKLFRQQRPGDWSLTLERLRTAVIAF